MTNFSTNQVMQFYALNSGDTVIPKTTAEGKTVLTFTYADGEKATSDKIENVMYGKLTKAAALATPYKAVTVAFDSAVNNGSPIKGQDYIVRVSYPEIGGLGREGWTTKTASARGTTAAAVADAIVKDLNIALGTDGVLEASVVSGNIIKITQTDAFEKVYKRGLRPVKVIDFEVTTAMVTTEDGEDVMWSKVETVDSGKALKGVYKLADMEYFALGERGDQYRYVDYVNAIETNYRVNLNNDYDILTIHYAYKGANQNSHKSEKDIIIAGPAATVDTLAKSLESFIGVQFAKVADLGTGEAEVEQ